MALINVWSVRMVGQKVKERKGNKEREGKVQSCLKRKEGG